MTIFVAFNSKELIYLCIYFHIGDILQQFVRNLYIINQNKNCSYDKPIKTIPKSIRT